jgi:hypothetical protein
MSTLTDANVTECRSPGFSGRVRADANSLLGAEGLPDVFRQFAHLGRYASLDALVNGLTPSLTARVWPSEAIVPSDRELPS